MDLDNAKITAKNLINKYNNSIYEGFEDDEYEEEYILMIGMYTAS